MTTMRTLRLVTAALIITGVVLYLVGERDTAVTVNLAATGFVLLAFKGGAIKGKPRYEPREKVKP